MSVPSISYHAKYLQSLNVEGSYKLLNDLDVDKAPGPDKIPNRILKYCATQIAQILQVIFIQQPTSGNLPEDWLTANITPIFKKGIDHLHSTIDQSHSQQYVVKFWSTLSIIILWSVYYNIKYIIKCILLEFVPVSYAA